MGTPPNLKGEHPFTPYSGFTPGTPFFSHYSSARWRYAPHDKEMSNNSKILRVTEMGI